MTNIENQNLELSDRDLDGVIGGSNPLHQSSDSDSLLKYAILYGVNRAIDNQYGNVQHHSQ